MKRSCPLEFVTNWQSGWAVSLVMPKGKTFILNSINLITDSPRERLRELMGRREDCTFVPIRNRFQIPKDPHEVLSRAIFGPSTIGDLQMARRTYNLIHMGVIPVSHLSLCLTQNYF